MSVGIPDTFPKDAKPYLKRIDNASNSGLLYVNDLRYLGGKELQHEVDIVVVGAGLAGLTTAWLLSKAGLEVRVLEARDRVGGRLYGYKAGERCIQLGGRWTGPGQSAVKSLASELDIEVISNLSFGGRANPGRGSEFENSAREIDELARSVPLDKPWQTPNAAKLDRQTLATWLHTSYGNEIAFEIGSILSGFLPEPQDVSLLHALFYLNSNGGFAGILGLDGAPHDSEMFEGGAHRLTDELYTRLRTSVKLSTPVSGLRSTTDKLVVQTDEGCVSARFAVVALPPVLAGRLRYEPAMPPDRDYLTQRMPIRGKIAVALLYDQPFWRESGESIFVDGNLTLWDEGGDELPAAVAGLVSIPRSRELSMHNPQDRKQAILACAAAHLGQRAATVCGYHEINWAAEPWSRGCNSFMTTGVWSTWGYTLREPVGRIHWAGAEMSDRFVGQMDGAVRSAQVTANRILETA